MSERPRPFDQVRERSRRYVILPDRLNRDPHGNERRRHRVDKSSIREAGCGADIRTVPEQPGHADMRTPRIHTHVIERGGRGMKCPLDGLLAGIAEAPA